MLRWRSWLIVFTVALALAAMEWGDAAAGQPVTLDAAIARALMIGPSVQSADAQNALNQARVEEARAPLLPSVAGNSEYYQPTGYDKTISNGGLTQAQLALTYTAFDGGRRLAQLRAARYAAQAAALGLKAAQAQVVFDTTVAYFDLLRERETETELAASLARLSKYVAMVEALQRSGRAIANDVLTIRVTRDGAELTLASARQTAAQASFMLGSMIGDLGDTELVPAEVAGMPAPTAGDFTQNPAYQAAARQLKASQLAVQAARSERYPNVNLALTTGWQGVYPPKTFGHHFGASYDGILSLPIFQGGLVRSHIDEALASEQAADAQQRQIELQVRSDLAAAKLRYTSAVDQLAILYRSQESASDAFALDWTRFLGGGNATVLEVTNAYQQAENLRVARFDQQFNARQAAAQVRLLLGFVR
jgi:outer membrane protein